MPTLEATTLTTLTKSLIGLGVVSAFVGLEPYIPFLIGGLALFSYMVSHNEIELTFKDGLPIILGAFLIGYLTKSSILPMADALHGLLIELLPQHIVEHSVSLKEGHAVESMVNVFSFIMGAFSRTIFLTLMQRRALLVKKIIDKGLGKDG